MGGGHQRYAWLRARLLHGSLGRRSRRRSPMVAGEDLAAGAREKRSKRPRLHDQLTSTGSLGGMVRPARRQYQKASPASSSVWACASCNGRRARSAQLPKAPRITNAWLPICAPLKKLKTSFRFPRTCGLASGDRANDVRTPADRRVGRFFPRPLSGYQARAKRHGSPRGPDPRKLRHRGANWGTARHQPDRPFVRCPALCLGRIA
jgi:hypothetical protein